MLFSDLLRGIEVDDVFTQSPLITETNQIVTEFTSLLATPLDNQLFLFAGTSSGDVLQVCACVGGVCVRVVCVCVRGWCVCERVVCV